MQQSIASQINNHDQGWVFTPSDFSGVASRDNIDQTLSRLTKAGSIRRLSHGLYDKPIVNSRFGILPPDIDRAANSYMSKFGYKVQTHPAKAAHILGLSDQVPSGYSYLTDGGNSIISIGNIKVSFKHASAKRLVGIGTKAGLVVQALYFFGKGYFDKLKCDDMNNDNTGDNMDILHKIKGQLSPADIRDLKDIMPITPVWIQGVIRQIVM
jgi:hypothetical protein